MLVQIDYTLEFTTPFHLGTGNTAALVDRTVIRDAQGKLYVPASTFKGVLREHCERLCRFYLPDEEVASPHDAYSALTQFGKAPSLISRIFGSRLYSEGLRFNDAKQDAENYKAYKDIQTSTLTQARIDRLTRTAVDKALFTSEFGARDMLFEGTIKGPLHCFPVEALATPPSDEKNASPTPTYSLLLLLASLLMIECIGGNKSAGKGQCRCLITEIQLDRRRCAQTRWQSWIERLDVLKDYPRTERGGQA